MKSENPFYERSKTSRPTKIPHCLRFRISCPAAAVVSFAIFRRGVLPPWIPENPFVPNFKPSRFDVGCCISRRHLVKSEFNTDFDHNIVFYQ